jgi:hypothetical protein
MSDITTTREALANALALVAESFTLTCRECDLPPYEAVTRAMRDHVCGVLAAGGDCRHFDCEETCECDHAPRIWVNKWGKRYDYARGANRRLFHHGDCVTTEAELAAYEEYAAEVRGNMLNALSFAQWQATEYPL